jgi:peptidoglycan/LPS O-acetylase OafA/YrhL
MPALTSPSTYASSFTGRDNAIGFLRWLFAVMVVLTHCVSAAGLNPHLDVLAWWSDNRDSLGGLAVAGFFVLSGYLVTQSWRDTDRATAYLWRRFLRIFPGFWVCLIVTAFVFAPIAWIHEHHALTGLFSFGVDSPQGYVLHNSLLDMRQTGIAGLLHHTPLALSGQAAEWNGSLWTLIYEFTCYLGVLALGLVGAIRLRWPVLAVCALGYLALVFWAVSPSHFTWMIGPLSSGWLVQLGFLFVAAAAVNVYSDRIPVDDRIGALSVVVVLVVVRTGAWAPVGYPALVYAVLWLAARLPLTRWERWGDLSYGTYIYAFPLQMLLAEFGVQRHGGVLYVFASLATATVAAFLSWHVVEKRALRLKRLVSRRRAAA